MEKKSFLLSTCYFHPFPEKAKSNDLSCVLIIFIEIIWDQGPFLS
jgi:hypothetical protein